MTDRHLRRRGRNVRRAARLADTGSDWLPPLERGLPYIDILTPERVHDESMKLLEEVGIDFRDDEAVVLWRAAGADVDGYRIRIDR